MATQRTRTHSVNRPASDQPSFLLDAAAELFLAAGFDKTSMNEIAARAGVSKTTVHAYFRDKLELFHAVIRRGASKMNFRFDQALLDSAHDTEEKLSRVALILLESMTEPESLAFLRILVMERDRIPEPLRAVHEFDGHNVINVVAAVLSEDAAEHGYSVPELNTCAALFTRTAVAGIQLSALLDPGFRRDRTLLQANADWITAVFLRGIRPRDGADSQTLPSIT
ncbi:MULTISPECIES: TetR/AcrR family transcriptional regulator [unclassified Streptomyces]|uniref:TetR/AcrR family transcriptional regulator n=1 Tax=unclassified Streptomyces TaxID=2593676 RepID=UPI002365C0A5|nr:MULTISPECIES: TetR/AcrR family transcriptional regulator [unclassified Streptomyces]MDF3139897.1 TetR/AcrR family transcriptional regulator [Streptomyces sp. T21Q-yed]WDF43986.1 TetR/AcrR family transcriptional regulator [Streptomyces sp. T12]